MGNSRRADSSEPAAVTLPSDRSRVAPSPPLNTSTAMVTSSTSGDERPLTGPVSSLSSTSLPLAHLNCSDYFSCRSAGLSLPNRVAMMAWHRGKAKISRLLSNPQSNEHTAHEATCRLPFEIVEMIITHLIYDLGALKRCSLTCRSWYTIAVPHIHHTLTLKDNMFDTVHRKLKPLSRLHELGLIPLVREIRVGQLAAPGGWFGPEAFSRNDLFYFSTFANVHTLRIQGLNIDRFMLGFRPFFHQFSPTLKSISLYYPTSSAPRDLPCFLTLFPNLDNVEIRQFFTSNVFVPDGDLTLFSPPSMQGQLVLHDFLSVEACTYFIYASCGLRFRHMVLRKVGACAPVLLEACAETLETLRFYVADDSG